ncbi:hypothetical protein FIBSPDRAFT_198702 [Athelia psychrophila]|uniref:Uncharacterized protein n=1 Tax=Athelia psychrophila TaxID=1759441 RepID=A0A165ZSF3_9AGAM|nr:hypothetical protein FIBSPDRAFT_198702 [Fibularhizoctonia sp. CBS 109695]
MSTALGSIAVLPPLFHPASTTILRPRLIVNTRYQPTCSLVCRRLRRPQGVANVDDGSDIHRYHQRAEFLEHALASQTPSRSLCTLSFCSYTYFLAMSNVPTPPPPAPMDIPTNQPMWERNKNKNS